jgi:hypothetical protein
MEKFLWAEFRSKSARSCIRVGARVFLAGRSDVENEIEKAKLGEIGFESKAETFYKTSGQGMWLQGYR